jgi:hypothetical protein
MGFPLIIKADSSSSDRNLGTYIFTFFQVICKVYPCWAPVWVLIWTLVYPHFMPSWRLPVYSVNQSYHQAAKVNIKILQTREFRQQLKMSTKFWKLRSFTVWGNNWQVYRFQSNFCGTLDLFVEIHYSPNKKLVFPGAKRVETSNKLKLNYQTQGKLFIGIVGPIFQCFLLILLLWNRGIIQFPVCQTHHFMFA